MHISYERYLDKILGGWIGKSAGGAIGARFEGTKGWIEIDPATMFPDVMPPNDDLDLQVLWLKVLEEKGAALTADDLADAWIEGCWYPFNEYGIFRRNYQLGIHPPHSGKFTNQFWETGMGCPIRAEVWGYVFPGAPDLAAHYASLDGSLDHTEQSVGAEQMFAAMSSMAFFEDDVRRLAAKSLNYLPKDTTIERLTLAAFDAYDAGLTLREARDRLMLMEGVPEACDSQINVPFTFLGLLYGGTDMQEAMLAALRCGYDTDCTLATAAALVGQILGASRIPQHILDEVGDDLVMGIQYNRDEMTLSALARDTARMGVLLSEDVGTGVAITGAPVMAPLPVLDLPAFSMSVDYDGLPEVAPGEQKHITIKFTGHVPQSTLTLACPEGWTAVPASVPVGPLTTRVALTLQAPFNPDLWPERNLFVASVDDVDYVFGVAGAGLWQFLGVYFDPLPDPDNEVQKRRRFNQHFAALDKAYLPEPNVEDIDIAGLYQHYSQVLGKPALIAAYERDVDLNQLIGLRGPYVAYLARTLVCPVARENAWFVVGNSDPYRLYLNGELVAEVDEHVYWSPYNNAHRVNLREGENTIILKLLRRGDDMRFTFGPRRSDQHPTNTWHHANDWMVDTADRIVE